MSQPHPVEKVDDAYRYWPDDLDAREADATDFEDRRLALADLAIVPARGPRLRYERAFGLAAGAAILFAVAYFGGRVVIGVWFK